MVFRTFSHAEVQKSTRQFLHDRQSFQVVNWVKTKPRLAGKQIPFGETRCTDLSILNGSKLGNIAIIRLRVLVNHLYSTCESTILVLTFFCMNVRVHLSGVSVNKIQ